MKHMKTIQEAACGAIDAAGGPAKLARCLLDGDYSKQEYLKMQRRISFWKRNGVAPKWVLQVEKFSGIPRHKLSPCLYPLDDIQTIQVA